MKYVDFVQLCERQWANGRGEVRKLCLSEQSYWELALDVTTRTQWPRIKTIVNPMTGEQVPIEVAWDTAEVYRPPVPSTGTTHVIRVSHSAEPVPPGSDQGNA